MSGKVCLFAISWERYIYGGERKGPDRLVEIALVSEMPTHLRQREVNAT